LSALGASVEIGETFVRVQGPLQWTGPLEIDLGNSGTSLRLLIAQAALGSSVVVLTGDRSLQARPNQELIKALAALGATVESNEGMAPIRIHGPLRAGTVVLPPSQSSQFGSALFLAMTQVGSTSRLVLTRPIHSLPYFELTLEMARVFGAEFTVSSTADALTVDLDGTGLTPPEKWVVEGDWSSAAFLLVAAWGAGRSIELDGLSATSAQSDRKIQSVLEGFGARFEWSSNNRTRFIPGGSRRVEHIDVRACPDLFPILCTLAALVPYAVRIDGAPNLRHKESDRICLMYEGLSRLGIECTNLSDGMIVGAGALNSGTVVTEHDHRIQMSFRVLSCLARVDIELDGYGSEMVSYPTFEAHLSALFGGGQS
jgi:3-phosphoshikimate 1-carboxyvinyltransferase